MLEFTSKAALQHYLTIKKNDNCKIGFVPTMGALHMGHVSLVKASNAQSDITVCSIFVNPTQFDNEEDLRKYPNLLRKDRQKLISNDCDILFRPSINEIYPNGKDIVDPPDIGYLTTILEGAYRPGHFEGMMQVVELLLSIVEPNFLFMGKKDYQQLAIVRKMVELKGINVDVIGMSIIRETNGLAMSSRNARLSSKGIDVALVINETLRSTDENLENFTLDELVKKAENKLGKREGLKLEYFKIVDRDSLNEPENMNIKTKLVALCAAWVEGVRLIDNLELGN